MTASAHRTLVEHRPRCQMRDRQVVTAATIVGGTRWLLHACDECGSVAIEQTPAGSR